MESDSATRHFRNGPVEFDFLDGRVRSVRIGGVEVMQQIYVAVRDKNWDTAASSLSNLDVTERDGEVSRIRFDIDDRLRDVHFVWKGEIVCDGDSGLSFSMDGVAKTSFMRNRIGFCCLHPLSCAGAECDITHPDGTVTRASFPDQVSPDQIFLSIESMRYRLAGGWLETGFEGEVFETEDQRNWSDASYKTYCTPLALPLPVRVEAGTRIFQRVSLRYKQDDLSGAIPRARDAEPVFRAENPATLPSLGLGVSVEDPVEEARAVVEQLSPEFIRLDIAFDGDCRDLEQRLDAVERLGCGVVVGLDMANPLGAEELSAVSEVMLKRRNILRGAVLLPPLTALRDAEWLARAVAALPGGVLIGAGCDTNLAELNRNRPDPSLLDWLVFAANPQVHAFDDRSIMENAAGLSSAAGGIGGVTRGKEIFLGPLTLKPERNAVAAVPVVMEKLALPQNVDPRQRSLFAAAWLVACLGEMARGGVAAASLFSSLTGWKGVRERLAGSPEPALFASVAGEYFPVYHVLRRLLSFSGAESRTLRYGEVYEAGGLSATKNGHTEIILYNLSSLDKIAGLPDFVNQGRYGVSRLDAESLPDAGRDGTWTERCSESVDGSRPLLIPAYSIVFLQGKGG